MSIVGIPERPPGVMLICHGETRPYGDRGLMSTARCGARPSIEQSGIVGFGRGSTLAAVVRSGRCHRLRCRTYEMPIVVSPFQHHDDGCGLVPAAVIPVMVWGGACAIVASWSRVQPESGLAVPAMVVPILLESRGRPTNSCRCTQLGGAMMVHITACQSVCKPMVLELMVQVMSAAELGLWSNAVDRQATGVAAPWRNRLVYRVSGLIHVTGRVSGPSEAVPVARPAWGDPMASLATFRRSGQPSRRWCAYAVAFGPWRTAASSQSVDVCGDGSN